MFLLPFSKPASLYQILPDLYEFKLDSYRAYRMDRVVKLAYTNEDIKKDVQLSYLNKISGFRLTVGKTIKLMSEKAFKDLG